MTLYELPVEYMRLLDMIEDDNVPADALSNAMEQIKEDLKNKVNSYGKILTQTDENIAMVDAEIKRLQERKKSLSEKKERMKEGIINGMVITEQRKIETPLFTFLVKDTAEKLVIDVQDDIPEVFYVPQPSKLDKSTLKKYLNDGNIVDFAHLEKGFSLQIK